MNKKEIAIYHMVKPNEDFAKATMDIYRLLKNAQAQHPNRPRTLYVDVEGHKTPSGEYNDNAFEFQKNVVIGFLLKFFTKVHLSLISLENTDPQCNDIPDNLVVLMPENKQLSTLDSLFIENPTNTEFVYEKDVFAYLKKLQALVQERIARENGNEPPSSMN